MTASRIELRRAVGRALQQVRREGRLSLDDVEQASDAEGMRITRSHLSRVENGQADLALPRFLCLMRAVGEPPGAVVDGLAALFDKKGDDAPALERRGFEALAAADPDAAARAFRAAARTSVRPLPRPTLEAWAEAEAALGRWSACAQALQLAIGPLKRAEPALGLLLAAAQLGARKPGLAAALARAAAERAPRPARLIEALALLAGEGDDAREAEAALGAAEDAADGPLELVGGLARAEALRRLGRPEEARRLAARAALSPDRTIRAEALLAAARALADGRRAAAALRLLVEARTLARAAGAPDLVARSHRAAEEIHRRLGNIEESARAARAARAVSRRNLADGRAPAELPLASLYRVLAGREHRPT